MKQKHVGLRIRRLREQKAWTQDHLAQATEISARTVQRAEEGSMSAETLMAIAGALDVEVEHLSAPRKPPSEYPRMLPALYYRDPNAAYQWLQEAFGFAPRMSIPGPDGRLVHAELDYDGGTIMMGQEVESSGWKSPSSIDGVNTASVFIFVEDIDLHFRQASAAGARIVVDPQVMHGMHRYLAADPEGHLWWFASPSQ